MMTATDVFFFATKQGKKKMTIAMLSPFSFSQKMRRRK
jgi:hypothetical protein